MEKCAGMYTVLNTVCVGQQLKESISISACGGGADAAEVSAIFGAIAEESNMIEAETKSTVRGATDEDTTTEAVKVSTGLETPARV